jgi:alpha-D-xyloside xylohydrolase
MMINRIFLICLLANICCLPVPAKQSDNQYVRSWKKTPDALLVETSAGQLKLRPYGFGALHVLACPTGSNNDGSYAVVKEFPAATFTVNESGDDIILKTGKFTLSLQKSTGQLAFYDGNNNRLIREISNKQTLAADSIEPAAIFQLTRGEALYGLGQFRDKALNLRGKQRELVQFNTQAAVPVVYSTAGWGLLWDNPSRTVFADTPEGMSFASDFGDRLSYYLFTGSSLDELVAAYRRLTGEQPMLPDWALGYHQSRNKYASQSELLGIAKRMQDEHIQMSSIFIDYFYWGRHGTGSHCFDEGLFPAPQKMLDTLHNKYRTKAVITIWPSFRKGISNYEELASKGLLLEGGKALDGTIYDVFNPEAREVYWRQVLPLAKLGIDGWFLDGPEPDQVSSILPLTTYAGPARNVRNIYPLLHSENFYRHLTALYPNKRPYIITRCAWAGQQRAGTAVWSGDIPTTFDELETQITAGLNFTAAGIPYWTTDIGGYSGGDPADEAYRELFTRWFEYGTFCPIFRCHGRRYPGDTKAPNELWAYGDEVQKICSAYIDLRYMLMPYIYTLSGDVTHKSYTPMRLLAFDFPGDEAALDCKDQFMYGPSLLVCPVLRAGATERTVYLPAGQTWIDFWTGAAYEGGRQIQAAAPKDRIPLYVKAGAIIPAYTDCSKDNTPDNPMNIYVYTGSDGSFDLYKDDGKSFNYRKGDYAYIPFLWDDKARLLTIGVQRGNYKKGKPQEFRLLPVDKQGFGSGSGAKVIKYAGKKLTVKL